MSSIKKVFFIEPIFKFDTIDKVNVNAPTLDKNNKILIKNIDLLYSVNKTLPKPVVVTYVE